MLIMIHMRNNALEENKPLCTCVYFFMADVQCIAYMRMRKLTYHLIANEHTAYQDGTF